MKLTQALNIRCTDRSSSVVNWRMRISFALVLVSAIAARAEDQAAWPTPPPFYRDKLDLMYWLDDQGQRHPVRSIDDW